MCIWKLGLFKKYVMLFRANCSEICCNFKLSMSENSKQVYTYIHRSNIFV